jgi:hypothetical protein
VPVKPPKQVDLSNAERAVPIKKNFKLHDKPLVIQNLIKYTKLVGHIE